MAMRFDWDAIDRELARLISVPEGLPLDRHRIEHFAQEIAAGRLSEAGNRLRDVPEPAGPDDIHDVERFSAEDRTRYTQIGREAIARGEVAFAVLNGGMATRFGGAVKGIVEAIGGRTFLELKLSSARRLGPVPLLVMNSFATHEATRAFLAAHELGAEVRLFLQGVSLRLTPRGELFRDDAGALSPYAPGHGDFPEALLRSGALEELARRGVRAVMLSNVDNLGAELDPLITGYHLAHGLPLTVEVARAIEGDVGGAPVRVGGHLQVVEGFRFPLGYDFGRNRFFNTNTFMFALDGLRKTQPLNWYYVEKRVGARRAVQIERLVGEMSAFVETAYLAAPRTGPQGRFYPTKTPADLEALRADPELVARFAPS